ncbi:MAG: phage infection protein [Candidatus Coatesbacteria bacterium]
MKTLKIDLQNCYGIRKLKYEFDFSTHNVVAIYAANGSMKSSLANTFFDLTQAVPSKDRVFPGRTCTRVITDESGTELPKERVFVVRPYDEVLGHTEKTSTLLVNAPLRKEYEELHAGIEAAKKVFLNAMKEVSGSKRDIEKEISSAFTKSDREFDKAIFRVEKEMRDQKSAPYSGIGYDEIFDDRIQAFLKTGDVRTAIKEYIEKYNELLAASTYFKKGVFNFYNAATIAKQLADNGFFEAKHSVTLNAPTKKEISSQVELEKVIEDEKNQILKSAELRKRFAAIDKQITKNATVRDFSNYLSENEKIIPALANVEAFREELWRSYFFLKIDLYNDLVAKLHAAEKRKVEIEAEAAKERTQWERVIELFNGRFHVPFRLVPQNRVAVILAQEPLLSLGFRFEDGSESATLERDELMRVLSTGEKKALYILNIIFEVEARRQANQETLFIVDDIADSFDYKNKYAIVEYLKEMAEDPHFYQVILTHNFDFFRTIQSRFVKYSQCLMASKTDSGLSINRAEGIRNIFVEGWKPHFFTDARKRVASIPFIRNIVEYTKGENDPEYKKLTSLLHWKGDSGTITQDDLANVFRTVFGQAGSCLDGTKPMVEVIFGEADACLQAADTPNLENKVVLSIAIRLTAERYMIGKIADPAAVEAISSKQTYELFKLFRERTASKQEAIDVIERVMLMTPENIHLNAFMYEPILDMSDEHLRKLYRDVKQLS